MHCTSTRDFDRKYIPASLLVKISPVQNHCLTKTVSLSKETNVFPNLTFLFNSILGCFQASKHCFLMTIDQLHFQLMQ